MPPMLCLSYSPSCSPRNTRVLIHSGRSYHPGVLFFTASNPPAL
jgi:hypothetical protein